MTWLHHHEGQSFPSLHDFFLTHHGAQQTQEPALPYPLSDTSRTVCVAAYNNPVHLAYWREEAGVDSDDENEYDESDRTQDVLINVKGEPWAESFNLLMPPRECLSLFAVPHIEMVGGELASATIDSFEMGQNEILGYRTCKGHPRDFYFGEMMVLPFNSQDPKQAAIQRAYDLATMSVRDQLLQEYFYRQHEGDQGLCPIL